MFLFPALAFAQTVQVEAEKTLQQKGIWDLVWGADPIVKFTLCILVACSIVSWAIIFYKSRQVRRAQNDARNFWATFAQAKTLDELMNNPHARSGPLYAVFSVGLESLQKNKKNGKVNKDQVFQKLQQAREEEIYKLEQYTPFLATTASTAPYVGLFGTVWGILMAFWAIGKAGSSSLATVGPYISEALIATAIGLAAAIPAVIAYNHFVHKIKIVIKMMDLFMDDLVLKIEEDGAP